MLPEKGDKPVPVMTRNKHAMFVSMLLASIVVLGGSVARADEPVTVSITIKDHQFEPAEVHAPAGKPLSIAVKNLDAIAAEFESDSLHFEKVIPPKLEPLTTAFRWQTTIQFPTRRNVAALFAGVRNRPLL